MNTSTPLLRMARLTPPAAGRAPGTAGTRGARARPAARRPRRARTRKPEASPGFQERVQSVQHRRRAQVGVFEEHPLAVRRRLEQDTVHPLEPAGARRGAAPRLGAQQREPLANRFHDGIDPLGGPRGVPRFRAFVNSSTSMAPPPSRVAARVAARASARASTAARSASAAAVASSAAAPRVSAASTTDLYADQRDQALEDVQQSFLRFRIRSIRRAPSPLQRATSPSPTPSSAARSRAGSFCSNEPSSSEVSVAAVSDAPQCPPPREVRQDLRDAVLAACRRAHQNGHPPARRAGARRRLQRARLAAEHGGFRVARRATATPTFSLFRKRFRLSKKRTRRRDDASPTQRRRREARRHRRSPRWVRRFRQTKRHRRFRR